MILIFLLLLWCIVECLNINNFYVVGIVNILCGLIGVGGGWWNDVCCLDLEGGGVWERVLIELLFIVVYLLLILEKWFV